MNLWEFIKDRFLFLLLPGITALFAGFLLKGLGIGGYAILFLSALYLLGILAALLLEYFRRRAFFRNAMENLERLDKKYLLSETLEEPGSLEARLCYEILQETEKSMNDRIARYGASSKEFRDYAESWMHEIKTPIAAALLIAENHPSSEMDSVREELERIDALVEQSMFYARSNTVEKDYLIREFSLSELVASALKKQASLLIESKCSVTREGLEETVYSDAKWMDFILGQILANAVKYADGPLSLRFSGRKNAQSVSLRIQDNGIGIASQDLPRIFEKGFTGTNGRNNRHSSGMGLYLCRKLCCKMGVGITVQSCLGKGTCVELVFPTGSFYERKD